MGVDHGGVAEVLASVHAALDEAESLIRLDVSAADADVLVCDVQSLRARVEALACAAAHQAESAGVALAHGVRRVSDRVACVTPTDTAVVRRDTVLGDWVAGFAQFSAAFRSGRIHREHVRAFKRVENPRTRVRLFEHQDLLVGFAESMPFEQFIQALRYWLLAADPDGAEPREQVERRGLSFTKRADGTVEGKFRLDAVAGRAFTSAVGQVEQQLLRDDAASDGPARTTTQRRADALMSLVTNGARVTPGVTKALLHVVMGPDVIEDWLARCAGSPDVDPHTLPLDATRLEGRCELDDGTPIHPAQAMAVLAIAEFRRLVLSQ